MIYYAYCGDRRAGLPGCENKGERDSHTTFRRPFCYLCSNGTIYNHRRVAINNSVAIDSHKIKGTRIDVKSEAGIPLIVDDTASLFLPLDLGWYHRYNWFR